MSLYTNKRNSPAKRYNHSEYICPENCDPKFIKQTFLSLKGHLGPDTLILGNFNTYSQDRTSR
jgi:hypothetical protein